MSFSDKRKVKPLHETENEEDGVPNFTIGSVITLFLFNYIFGFIAFYFTRLQMEAMTDKSFKKARSYSRKALIAIIIGILLGLATYTVSLTLYFTYKTDNSCDCICPSTTSTAMSTTRTRFTKPPNPVVTTNTTIQTKQPSPSPPPKVTTGISTTAFQVTTNARIQTKQPSPSPPPKVTTGISTTTFASAPTGLAGIRGAPPTGSVVKRSAMSVRKRRNKKNKYKQLIKYLNAF